MCIRDSLKALQADGQGQVAYPLHFLTEILVYQCAVGKCMEIAVVVFLAQTDDVCFAHQRLAAGIHVEVNAQLLALGDDAAVSYTHLDVYKRQTLQTPFLSFSGRSPH